MPTSKSNERLTRHLERVHFACKCGCGFDDADSMLVSAVEDFIRVLEAQTGHEMTVGRLADGDHVEITGPLRCKTHNETVGGAPNSQHVLGKAVDIQAKGFTGEELAGLATEIPSFRLGGIGTYKSRVHVDVRDYKARWNG